MTENSEQNLREEIEELKKELRSIKNDGETKKEAKETRDSISRRNFLKGAFGGLAGFSAAALLPSVSAFDFKTDNGFQIYNSTDSKNLELDTNGKLETNQIRSASGKFKVQKDGTVHSGNIGDPVNHIGSVFASNIEPEYVDVDQTNKPQSYVADSGSVQLESGSATISTGLPLGSFDIKVDPSNGGQNSSNIKVSSRLFYDNAASEMKVEIYEDGTSIGNPTVQYEITFAKLSNNSYSSLSMQEKVDLARMKRPQVGGNDGYDPTEEITASDADVTISSQSDFKNNIDSASTGDVIWIDSDITIDNVNYGEIVATLPEDSILAGDRGQNGSAGPQINIDNSQVFLLQANKNCRVTGIRFKAPITTHESSSWEKQHRGIMVDGSNVEIDNCRFRGWGHTGILVGNSNGNIDNIDIHHNEFVDNPMQALGYGVAIRGGHVTFRENYGNNNRHTLSCDGDKDSSYEAFNNIIGVDGFGHAFDMHRGDQGSGSGPQAGVFFDIHHNFIPEIRNPNNNNLQSGIFIRGVPLERSYIRDNHFEYPQPDSMSDPSGSGGPSSPYPWAFDADSDDTPSEDQNTDVIRNTYVDRNMWDPL